MTTLLAAKFVGHTNGLNKIFSHTQFMHEMIVHFSACSRGANRGVGHLGHFALCPTLTEGPKLQATLDEVLNFNYSLMKYKVQL